jgi:hypothetical protein
VKGISELTNFEALYRRFLANKSQKPFKHAVPREDFSNTSISKVFFDASLSLRELPQSKQKL